MLFLEDGLTRWMIRGRWEYSEKSEVKLIESEHAVREEVKRAENELQCMLDLILKYIKENKNK